MQVVHSTIIAKDTVEMVLKNRHVSEHAVPGQFLHIQVVNHTLRRPVSIADVDKNNGTVTILFKRIGSGTKQLATTSIGEIIYALGPNGHGFPLNARKGETILIVGGGIGVPPLYYLAKQLKTRDITPIIVLGFQTKDFVFYEEPFKQLGTTHIVTNDGSYGHKGFVTNVIEAFDKIDSYYACGPLPMLKAVKAQCSQIPGYLSLEERMGCGVGACLACVVETNDGAYRKICRDGPVFQAQEVRI